MTADPASGLLIGMGVDKLRVERKVRRGFRSYGPVF